jgi:hypothetical protein
VKISGRCSSRRWNAGVLLGLGLVAATDAFAADSVPGRTVVLGFMAGSSLSLSDLNGDCGVTDVDVALALNQRLISEYGQVFEPARFPSGESVVDAIKQVVRSSFGKTTPSPEPVGLEDVLTVLQDVDQQSVTGDVNLDGVADLADVGGIIDRLGNQVDDWTVDHVSRELFEYVGLIRQRGVQVFMAGGCKPPDHMKGVSDSWPLDPPDWWPPNHLSSMSRSYDGSPPAHDSFDSRANPPQDHSSGVSSQWPPNHNRLSSATWPPDHSAWSSTIGTPPNPVHYRSVSAGWPPAHAYEASHSWPSSHDRPVSSTWWPNHTRSDSSSRIFPPMHAESLSGQWSHQASVSQSIYPPNHYDEVSGSWGPTHNISQSSAFPPAHVSFASHSWPGPQTWPANHTLSMSRSWGDPASNPWPVFPPGHSWFTTFRDVISPIVPRIPWSSAAGGGAGGS